VVLTVQRQYGSFALTSANGIIVESIGGTHLNGVDFESRIDGEGSIRTRDALEGFSVDMEGEITGSGSNETVRTNVDAFLAATRNREDYLQIFSDRRILCGASSAVDTDFMKGMQYSRVKWKATFTSRFPTWESTTTSSGTISASGSGISTRGAMPAHAGTAPVWPQITVTNTAGSAFSASIQLILTNVSTNAQLKIDGLSLGSGQAIVIDMLNKRFGDGISIPTMPSGVSGEFWEISPGATQQLEIVTSTNASVSISVETLFRAQYWAP